MGPEQSHLNFIKAHAKEFERDARKQMPFMDAFAVAEAYKQVQPWVLPRAHVEIDGV
jgi:hypothetical protein